MAVRRAEDFHDARELLLLVLTREYGVAGPKLREDAAERPHVDAKAVAAAENDLGTAVEAGLDVGVHLLLFAAGGTKVDDADVGFAGFAEEDVFGFEVAVDDAFLLEEHQTGEQLAGEATDEWQREAGEVVGADEFVEVDAEAGRDDAEVGAEVKGRGDGEGGVFAVGILR